MTTDSLYQPTVPVLQPASELVDAPHPDPSRLGVSLADNNVLEIAVYAPRADNVDFCVIEPGENGEQSERRWRLYGPLDGVWHGRLEGFGLDTVYGFRAFGTWNPDLGYYYNPSKLLLDPYGKGLTGTAELSPALHAHTVDHDLFPTGYPLEQSSLNSALFAPKSVVVKNHFGISDAPRIPWDETVVYEAHVKGFTKNMPGVPPELQGTYAGLAHPKSVEYLKSLGITAIELLPVHAKMDEPFLTDRGLTNYWGYSTLSFFTPEPTYATKAAQDSGAQAVIDEFRGMVSLLHEAGIEVILDVVYNHTCEGGDTGPTVCWRGLDALTYYRFTDSGPRSAINDTGTGNTVNFSDPGVVKMTLDSLRYWVSEMGVDGFRFDLGVTLGRLKDGFTPFHPLFVAIGADPVLKSTKMIAEPWDIGPGGWQTGNFPIPFSEWNDRFRDSVRSFWLADFQNILAGRGAVGPNDLATRLAGSADLFRRYDGATRGPRASINFVAAHDGFTMADLTSYEHKHNMANLENNHDGSGDNRSWNHGVEGVPGAPLPGVEAADTTGIVEDILFARERSKRNLFTTLMVSAGTPMFVAGDEFGRTQYGNNNAYCQDSAISWIDWDWADDQVRLLETCRYLIALRALHPVMRPPTFAAGTPQPGDPLPDLTWFAASGKEMKDEDWSHPENRVFQMRRSGLAHADADLLVVINGTLTPVEVTLPATHGGQWILVHDTSWMSPQAGGIASASEALNQGEHLTPGGLAALEPQSMGVYLSPPQLG